MTIIYQADALTMSYIGSREASTSDYDLLDKSKVLTSRLTTLTPPPSTLANQVAILQSKDVWIVVDDYRGYVGYDSLGVKHEIEDVGTTPDPSWSTSPPFILIDAQALKTAEINAQTKAAITAGFNSSALGNRHLYQSEIEDQLNLSGIAASGSDWPFKCSADDGVTWSYLAHTAAQIQQVTTDGITHKLTQLQAGEIRKAQVNSLVEGATQADVDAI